MAAEICCEEAKSMPAASASASAAATAIARRRRRMDMAVSARFAAGALAEEAGAARGGKRQRMTRAGTGAGGAGFRSRWWPRYGVTSVCGRRREMEDAVSIRPDFLPGSTKHHFFAVFDGHGCSHVCTHARTDSHYSWAPSDHPMTNRANTCQVARMCQDRMHELVVDAYRKAAVSGKDTPSSPEWKEVMEKGFAAMDNEATSWAASRRGGEPACRCELRKPARPDHVGSTAVVAVVGPTRVVVANSGDSRAVLCRAGVPVPLSVDHKPDRPDELERIKSAGGRVIYWDGARVLGVLAMSRAIGDGYLKPYVTSEPEVTVTERSDDDECLILASDGLWDVVTNEMACEVVRACFRSNGPPSPRPNGVLPPPAGAGAGAGGGDAVVKGVDKAESDKACADAALLLAKLALARRSADNVSAVVVDLRRLP
uniref:protein-serine/threonine phosphatase n=1 Tax=Leersia perrieri TaxID=77586 RepID=A0A0D9WH97_9ORYZ